MVEVELQWFDACLVGSLFVLSDRWLESKFYIVNGIPYLTFYGIYDCNLNSNGNAHISLLERCASNGPDDGHVDRNR